MENIFLMVISTITLLVSILFLMIYQVFELFKRDKILDLEQLKQQGLTIVECVNCHKMNVLEDQYCIFCGEKLKENEQ